jgi:hypothetical protein
MGKRREEIKKIFEEIFKAIEKTKSDIPVTIEESRFLKELKKIKRKYEN